MSIRSALAIALVGCGCGAGREGPSASVEGPWRAAGLGHLGQAYEMSLTQSGDTIAGRACGMDGATRLFEEVPVSGDHPNIRFSDPSGGVFSGDHEIGRDEIAGTYDPDRVPLRFRRGGSGTCAGARRPAD